MSKNIVQQMLEKAKAAMQNAYCPYSHFYVGAAILADDGNIYAGCNIENASYRVTQCAESSAVGNMVSHGAKRIKKIVVVADSTLIPSPCGACRQQLREFSDKSVEVHMFNNKGDHDVMTMDELLVKSFGPEFLKE